MKLCKISNAVIKALKIMLKATQLCTLNILFYVHTLWLDNLLETFSSVLVDLTQLKTCRGLCKVKTKNC